MTYIAYFLHKRPLPLSTRSYSEVIFNWFFSFVIRGFFCFSFCLAVGLLGIFFGECPIYDNILQSHEKPPNHGETKIGGKN